MRTCSKDITRDADKLWNKAHLRRIRRNICAQNDKNTARLRRLRRNLHAMYGTIYCPKISTWTLCRVQGILCHSPTMLKVHTSIGISAVSPYQNISGLRRLQTQLYDQCLLTMSAGLCFPWRKWKRYISAAIDSRTL